MFELHPPQPADNPAGAASADLRLIVIQEIFRQRSGRVIALSRACLASFFILAIVLDASQSGARAGLILLLLSAYTLFAGFVLVLTWNSWWFETRFSLPAHAIDLLVFTLLVALTEGYVSPFFTFFVFLVLSSTIRGGWREALVTTGIVIMLFLVAAGVNALGSSDQGQLEVQRFVVRGAHLVVLSLMIIWFGLNQFGAPQDRLAMLLDDVPGNVGPPIRQALEHAARRIGAGRVVLAWFDPEEPWLFISTLEAGNFEQQQLGPDEFDRLLDEEFADRPFLFDVGERRVLVLRAGRSQSLSGKNPISQSFAARFDIHSGLAVPIKAQAVSGFLFALSVPGLSSDRLRNAAKVGDEISSAFERTALLSATQEAVATRARLRLARDLHDSVVQFLAGMGLKLEGLRKVAAGVPDANREIDDLQVELVQEQRDLRRLIAALRDATTAQSGAGLADHLALLAKRIERQWGVACQTVLNPSLEMVPAGLRHDIEQLIREAAANAVRHGGARKVRIDATVSDGQLRLDIRDDGCGFPIEGDFDDGELLDREIGPKSLHERIHVLKGTMRLASRRGRGLHLAIALPLTGSAA